MGERMPLWLDRQAYLLPEGIALEKVDGTTWTFKQMQQQSKQIAKQMATLNIKEGEKIALLAQNSENIAFIAHACTYIGAVLVLLNTKLTNRELTYQLKTADVQLLIGEEQLLTEKGLDFSNMHTFEAIFSLREANILLKKEIDMTQPYTMMFTSGTTGYPKAVVHTYSNHWWSAVSSALNLGIHKNDKWLLTLPMFHIGGFSTLVKSVIYGMTVFMMEKYDREIVYEAMKNRKITIVSFVTLMLKNYIEDNKGESFPSNVRCILLGGGSVPSVLLDEVEKKSIPLFQSYGMTETTSQIVTLSEQDARQKLGASGKALFPADIQIDAPNEDGIGEILVRGPMVMEGYYKNDMANEKSFHDGWFYTGDLGRFDEEGFLYVVDRRNDLIISGGENIYPTEIEQVLLKNSNVIDAAVVGKRDDVWGEVPVAFIVTDKKIDEAALRESLRDSLASYKIPKQFFIVDVLPRNASNKIMRHKLAEQL